MYTWTAEAHNNIVMMTMILDTHSIAIIIIVIIVEKML